MSSINDHLSEIDIHLRHLVQEKREEDPSANEILWLVRIPDKKYVRVHQYKFYGLDATSAAESLDKAASSIKRRYDQYTKTLSIGAGDLNRIVQHLVHEQRKLGVLDLGYRTASGWQSGWPKAFRKLSELGQEDDTDSEGESDTIVDHEYGIRDHARSYLDAETIQRACLRCEAVYSKGTVASLISGNPDPTRLEDWTESEETFVCCIIEDNLTVTTIDGGTRLAIILVDTTNGELFYDEFEDDALRYDLSQKLYSFKVVEFLVIGTLSKPTEKLLHHYQVNRSSLADKGPARDNFETPSQHQESSQSSQDIFQSDPGGFPTCGPQSVLVNTCLSVLTSRFEQCGLAWLLKDWSKFQPLSEKNWMTLNTTTANQLELCFNRKDATTKHTLFACLGPTKTTCGRRELRVWLARPLIDLDHILERQSAVGDLVSSKFKQDCVSLILQKVGSFDLDRYLFKIMCGKYNGLHVLKFLKVLQRAAESASELTAPLTSRLNQECRDNLINLQPLINELLNGYIEGVDAPDMSNGPQIVEDIIDGQRLPILSSFFTSGQETGKVLRLKQQVRNTQKELIAHRKQLALDAHPVPIQIRKYRGSKSDLIYVSGARGSAPRSWQFLFPYNGSYYTETRLEELSHSYHDALEKLLEAEQDEIEKTREKTIVHAERFRTVIRSVEFLDCIRTLAIAAVRYGWVLPSFTDADEIEIHGFRHPVLLAKLLTKERGSLIANDLHLSQENIRCALLTGPNSSGKTCLAKSVALCMILAQMGSFIPAQSAKLCIVDGIYVRMGAYDNLTKSQSTFMVELAEAKDIIQKATKRSLVIFDELGRGSSTRDGLAIAQSVLEYVTETTKCFTIFTTHHQGLMGSVETIEGLQHYTMDFSEVETNTGYPSITPKYHMVQVSAGSVPKSHGLAILAKEIAIVRPDKVKGNSNDSSRPRKVNFNNLLTLATRRAGELEADVRTKQADGRNLRNGIKALKQALQDYPDSTQAI